MCELLKVKRTNLFVCNRAPVSRPVSVYLLFIEWEIPEWTVGKFGRERERESLGAKCVCSSVHVSILKRKKERSKQRETEWYNITHWV